MEMQNLPWRSFQNAIFGGASPISIEVQGLLLQETNKDSFFCICASKNRIQDEYSFAFSGAGFFYSQGSEAKEEQQNWDI